jgi:hypothetical protein
MLHVCGVATIVSTLVLYLENMGNGEDMDFLSFISGRREWESPPSIWSLGTLTSLINQARGLVA